MKDNLEFSVGDVLYFKGYRVVVVESPSDLGKDFIKIKLPSGGTLHMPLCEFKLGFLKLVKG